MNQKKWKKALSHILVGCMVCSLLSTPVALAAASNTTTKFPEYYSQYGDASRPGVLIGADNVALGLKMTEEEIDNKIEALINTMTTEEKYYYLGGNGTGTVYGNAGYIPGTPRLGVPESRSHDGPTGTNGLWPTTNIPQRQMMAATWDDELAYGYGQVSGTENRASGGNMQLGSQYDITRTPEFGRAKDQLGEDPYLLGRIAAQETKGIQDQGTMAVGKHFAAFAESASPAAKTDVKVSEQALHEVYLPAFEAAVKEGGMVGLMSSYNSINGTFASSNEYLQLNVLRDMWGYKGFTITDWGGNDGYTMNKGTDIEMPTMSNNSQSEGEALVAKGTLTQAELDEMVNTAVRHVLYAFGKTGYLYLVQTYTGSDGKLYAKEEPGRTEPLKIWGDSDVMALSVQDENNQISLDIARGGGVLLENNGALPIAQDGSESVAMIGLGAKYTLSGSGGERSYGTGYEMTSPYESMKKIIGAKNVSLSAVFDDGGDAIPAGNLFYLDGNGKFQQGFQVSKNEGSADTVTGSVIEYLAAKNSYDGGTAFDGDNSSYVWTTYIKVDESGEYVITLHGLGGDVSAKVSNVAYGDPALPVPEEEEDDSSDTGFVMSFGTTAPVSKDPNYSLVTVTYATTQGVQWHNSDHCTDTGMAIASGATLKMEAGKYYKVEITGVANRTDKDMQLRLAWMTPATTSSYDAASGKISGGAYDSALALAKSSDKTVVFVSATAKDTPDTRDPDHLNLDADQERLILDVAQAAHSAGKKVIVVVNNETAITMHNWVNQVDAVLMMYHPGQKGGQATAELLTGVVNPSGKLAYAIPMEGNQTLVTYTQAALDKMTQPDESGGEITAEILYALNDGELERYFRRANMDLRMRGYSDITTVDLLREALAPGSSRAAGVASIINQKVNSGTVSYYDEGILTGYRFYDATGLKPRYDFGYGLSYTTFEYSNLSVKENAAGEQAGYDVTFTVKNTGSVAGSEVAQLYLGQADMSKLPAGIQSAPYQLAGYTKIKDLKAGESRTVTLHVDERSLSYWNSTISGASVEKWTLAEGDRKIYVGGASDDLPLSANITVKADPAYAIVTRGTLVNELYQREGSPAAANAKFTDVTAANAKAVGWASGNQIVVGYSSTSFGPNDAVTREQLAAFLYRYAQFKGLDLKANSDLSDFSDSDRVSKWAEEALRWAVGQGVLSTSDGRLNPRGGVTAGEMDAALARLPK